MALRPLYVERVWGGGAVFRALGRKRPEGASPIGESWEISAYPGAESVVKNGPLRSLSLGRVVALDPSAVLGRAVARASGGAMPLLVKYVAAEDDLSIQVHPDDAAAARLEGEPRGKTEAWHVVAARKGAAIWVGLKTGAVRNRRHLADLARTGRIARVLKKFRVAPGETYFLPAGTVHAIGRGVVVLEVQQSSDRTYRLFDWNRTGLDGRPRPLHVDKAARVADLSGRRGGGLVERRRLEAGRELLVSCPEFTVEKWCVPARRAILRTLEGRFLVLAVLRGEARIRAGARSVRAERGESILVPAGCGAVAVDGPARGSRAAAIVAVTP